MKDIRIIARAMFALCLLVVTATWAQGADLPASAKSDEEQIKNLEKQQVQAQMKGDTSFIDKYYADDCWIIHSDGTQATKAEEVANLKSGSLKYESIDVRDEKVRILGPTAIVNLQLSFKGAVNGKPYSGEIRRTQVWAKQKGNWKVVVYHVTRVQ